MASALVYTRAVTSVVTVTLRTVPLQAPLSMGFPRQKHWSGLPFPSPRDLPDPGLKPASPLTSALQAESLPLSHQGILKIF